MLASLPCLARTAGALPRTRHRTHSTAGASSHRRCAGGTAGAPSSLPARPGVPAATRLVSHCLLVCFRGSALPARCLVRSREHSAHHRYCFTTFRARYAHAAAPRPFPSHSGAFPAPDRHVQGSLRSPCVFRSARCCDASIASSNSAATAQPRRMADARMLPRVS